MSGFSRYWQNRDEQRRQREAKYRLEKAIGACRNGDLTDFRFVQFHHKESWREDPNTILTIVEQLRVSDQAAETIYRDWLWQHEQAWALRAVRLKIVIAECDGGDYSHFVELDHNHDRGYCIHDVCRLIGNEVTLDFENGECGTDRYNKWQSTAR